MLKEVTQSRFFMKTFMYYTAILIIPIFILSFASYSYNMQKAEVNVREKIEQDARNFTSLIDKQLNSIQSLAARIDMLSWVWKLTAEIELPENGFTAIQKKEIINDLKIFMTDHIIVRDMILFFPHKGMAISSSGWFDIDSYFNWLGKDERIKELKNGLTKRYNFSLQNSEGLFIKNNPVLWLAHSIDKISVPRAQAVFLIDKNAIRQFIQSISPDRLYKVEIYTREGDPVIQAVNNDISDKKNLRLLTIASNSFGWNYHLFFDSSFTQEQYNLLLFLILTLLCTVIVGPVIAFFLAYLTYEPLRRLMNRIFPDNKYKEDRRLNEYNILENTFTRLINDNKEMYERVNRYSKYAQNDMLIRLLKGYFYKNGYEDLEYYGINYSEKDKFAVLLIDFSEINEKKEELLKKIMIADMLIEKRLKQKPFEYKIINMVEENTVVIISDGQEKICEDAINQISAELQKEFNDFQGLNESGPEDGSIHVWYGKVEQGIIGISKSYQSAKEARDVKILARNFNQKTDIIKNYYYPTDWEVQLINNLKIGKEEAVINIIDAVKAENEKRMLNADTKYALINTIKNTIMRVFAELNITWSEEELRESIEDYHRENLNDKEHGILKNEWVDIYGTCHMICKRISDNDNDEVDITNQILEYINKNYTDASISLKQLAGKFGVSISTISKLFKRTMGINFYDYVSRLRMEKAKELLSKGDTAIKEICKIVGYENEFSFRRAFERYEGISVSDYRKSVKNKT